MGLGITFRFLFDFLMELLKGLLFVDHLNFIKEN